MLAAHARSTGCIYSGHLPHAANDGVRIIKRMIEESATLAHLRMMNCFFCCRMAKHE